MLNLIKNLKVGTKLALILAPPVVVLIVLAVLGFQQRSADADEAQRVESLAQFASYTSRLSHALELESLATAEFMAADPGSPVEAERRAALDDRRAATDTALGEFRDQVEAVDPAGDEATAADQKVGQALDTVDTRLRYLETVRLSVTDRSISPTQAVDDVSSVSEVLVQVNVALATATSEPDLAAGLRSFANLGRVKTATATEAGLLTLPALQGEFRQWTSTSESVPCGTADPDAAPGSPDAVERTPSAAASTSDCDVVALSDTARNDIEANQLIFNGDATPEHFQILRDADAGQSYRTEAMAIHEAASEGSSLADVPTDGFVESARSYLDAQQAAETAISEATQDSATVLATAATRDANLYLVGTVSAVAIAFILAFFVFRATTIPLRKLTSAAYSLSTDRLPALVDRLRSPESDTGESLAETLKPIDIDSTDEIGQLADAFNSIQQVTVEVAEEQAALLRKGIGDIFINLARRNQTLLDRQIEFIDQLESNEEDPDQLDNLFKLDHLATRMRRNAESLLVLAGAEPPRRRGRPVSLADVVRVAIGEVEDFARIQLLSLEEATVGGNVAVDLAHLLSELMENATHFSPPDTMVEIVGHRSESGYTLSVSDQGIGMSADQLAEANEQLAKPPLVGLALSRSLGFIVIGRLASRFDVQVRLTASPSGGVTAMVNLPREIITFADDVEDQPEAPGATATVVDDEPPLVLTDDTDLIDELLDGPTAEAEPEIDLEPAIALEPDEDFERSLESLRTDDLPEAPVEPEVPRLEPDGEAEAPSVGEAQPEVVEAPPVAEAPAEPEPAPITAAGLVKRTPKKRSENATGGMMPGSEGPAPSSSRQSARSPEEIRKMLSRYRSGLNKGRAGADADGGGE